MIFVMDKGRIVESGTHDELMKMIVKKNKSGAVIAGFYHNLWKTQQGDDEEQVQERVHAIEASIDH